MNTTNPHLAVQVIKELARRVGKFETEGAILDYGMIRDIERAAKVDPSAIPTDTVTSGDSNFESIVASSEHEAFKNLANELAAGQNNTVFPRLVVYTRDDRGMIKRLLVRGITQDTEGVALHVEPTVLGPIESKVAPLTDEEVSELARLLAEVEEDES